MFHLERFERKDRALIPAFKKRSSELPGIGADIENGIHLMDVQKMSQEILGPPQRVVPSDRKARNVLDVPADRPQCVVPREGRKQFFVGHAV